MLWDLLIGLGALAWAVWFAINGGRAEAVILLVLGGFRLWVYMQAARQPAATSVTRDDNETR